MILRRVFINPEATVQTLVVFNTATGTLDVAHRADDWATWSAPLRCVRVDDDPAEVNQPGARRYGPSGRTFSPGTPP